MTDTEEGARRPRHHVHKVRWAIGPVVPKHPPHLWKGPTDMSFTLNDGQRVLLSVAGEDVHGHAVPLTGTPVFAVDDPSILTMTDNGDGTAWYAATGVIGTATASCVDDETSGKEFIGSLAIDVIGGEVFAVSLTPGVPEDIPPVPTP